MALKVSIYICIYIYIYICIYIYAWVTSLSDKEGITITNAFQRILDGPNDKPKKIWVDKGSEFYNRSMKPFLQNNDIEIYSTHNEGKSLTPKRLIRTIKSKFRNT